MLNLDPNKAIIYTDEQQQAIDTLVGNRGSRTGKELWEDRGPNDIFVSIKDCIKKRCLEIQSVRCAYCESILEYGGVQIEHFAPKWKYQQFVYERLNLVCTCTVCNSFAKKGKTNTIDGNANPVYEDNKFIYVHPYLDNPNKEIRYRDPLRILIDKEHSTTKGKKTIELFHWDTLHARKKRVLNLLTWTTSNSRRKMISEILTFHELV